MTKKKNGSSKPADQASQGGEAGAQASNKPISKIEAVRRAMRAKGSDAKPVVIQGFLKEQFNLDMTTEHISNYKSDIRRRRKSKKKGSKAAKPAASVKTGQPAPVAKAGTGPGGFSLADIRATKDLMKRLGVARLRDLIELLAH